MFVLLSFDSTSRESEINAGLDFSPRPASLRECGEQATKKDRVDACCGGAVMKRGRSCPPPRTPRTSLVRPLQSRIVREGGTERRKKKLFLSRSSVSFSFPSVHPATRFRANQKRQRLEDGTRTMLFDLSRAISGEQHQPGGASRIKRELIGADSLFAARDRRPRSFPASFTRPHALCWSFSLCYAGFLVSARVKEMERGAPRRGARAGPDALVSLAPGAVGGGRRRITFAFPRAQPLSGSSLCCPFYPPTGSK